MAWLASGRSEARASMVCTGSPGMNRGMTQSTVTATKNVTA
jgi:hypothetical protein